ncbi:MAG: PQQ-dependent sugar dehydrogenase, partial [Bacteroidota bacterium]
YFQPQGLDTAVPIGKFLNGNLPEITPGDGQNLQWSVEPAFPNLRFNDPLVIKPHPRQNRLFVASRNGLIEHFVYDQNTNTKQTLIDLRPETAVIWDGGFLGLAFHPDFGKAGSPNRNYFYVYYSAKGPNGEEGPFACNSTCFSCENNANFFGAYMRLSRYTVNEGTLTVNKNSEVQLFNVRAFNGTHRGGGLNFGKDGFLYLALGDQARRTTAQDIVNNFEGGVIRIDVDKKGGSISHAPRRKMGVHAGENDEFTGSDYFIPNDNPWVINNNNRFEEYYQNGHRNPHRMTMDRETGEFWIGEIGAGSKEEVTILKKGHNAGWPIYEGNNFRTFRACNSDNLPLGVGSYNPPVVDFLRSETNAIIGGYVYRGAKFPSLYGKYLCGGYSKNNLFVIDKNNSGNYNYEIFANFSPGRLITWGEGPDAELFLGRQANNTTLYQLKATGSNPPAPRLLSQTGAFSNLVNLTLTDGLIPYEMIEPFWSDGADKNRWIAIPNNGTHNTAAEQIQFSENGNWTFPKGTVIIKHFELGGKRLETRFEVKGENNTYYYLTYKWNAAGTDAELLTTGLDEQITVNGQTQTYHYPSPSECLTCHQAAAGSVLGLKTRFINKAITYPTTGQTTNQLVALSSIGVINQNITNAATNNFITVAAHNDLSQSLELRARSYLDVNCSGCHQPGTGNRAVFDARITTPLAQQNYINGDVGTNFGLNNPKLIVEGDVNRSMIHYRMNSLATGVAMPPLSKNKIDDEGVQVIADWINSLGNTDPDNDGDGFPQSQDCNDNDSNLTVVGASCNDSNPNTNNDVVQANCICAGEADNGGGSVTETCGTSSVTHGNGTITMMSGGDAAFFKILDGNWQYIDNCGYNCGGSFTVTGLAAGDYRLFFEDSGYQPLCDMVITLGSGGGNDPDNDGDGVPQSQDCNDNDPNLTTVGAPCNDGNNNTNNDVVQANCTCAGTNTGGGDPDNDGDGVPQSQDCNDNDPNLTTVGAPCNDGNNNSNNDVVQANCTCAGTSNGGGGGTVTETCGDNTVVYGDGTITMSGGSAAFFKIFDGNWGYVANCGYACGGFFTVNGLAAGDYRLFYEDANYQPLCDMVITLGSGGSGNNDPDNDGDGVPQSQDCNDNDANLTTAGAACDDGNNNTINDVVQANCTCAGTSAGGGGGTVIEEDCNGNTIAHGNGTITLTSNGTAAFFQILDAGYGPVDHCGWQCAATFSVSGLPAGRYLIYFQNSSYTTICEKWIDMTGGANANAPAGSRIAPHLSLAAYAAGRVV